MVVTPYNAQVRCLTARLPAGVRIGTVDKFQGQEAPVVFFSMATSSGAEVPRNVEFLYSRNRLNVAVSRARCLAVLVCNPELLHVEPRSIEQMRLVNALCRLVELTESAGQSSVELWRHEPVVAGSTSCEGCLRAQRGSASIAAMTDLVFGPGTPFVDQVRLAAGRFPEGRVQVAVAWATDEGAAMFLDAVSDLAQIEVLVGINAQGTTVEALLRLCAAADYLGVHYRHPRLTYHPKAYVFDDGQDETDTGLIAVGSSNMTLGGLYGNVETSVVIGPAVSELGSMLTSWREQWSDLVGSPFTAHITDPEVIEELYRAGHVLTERERQSRRKKEAGGQRVRRDRGQASGGAGAAVIELPTEQPKHPPPFDRSPVSIPFEIADQPDDEAPEDSDPATDVSPGAAVGDETAPAVTESLLFVRTLTANDVAKLVPDDDGDYGEGTFEPDIGLAVRDLHPGFWGWPDNFTPVKRTLIREEWSASARLFSSVEPSGVEIEVMLWFREARPGHAAEFRLRPGPVSVIRRATPSNFGTDGLLVIRRAEPDSSRDFVVRLIARDEPDRSVHDPYLSDQKPAHRYGYARLPSAS